MNKTDKVICKDCKWQMGLGWGCVPKIQENRSFDLVFGHGYKYHECNVKNQNGHCEDYKEKLFKKLQRKICNLFRK
jgi:hypothetical protein